MEPDTPSPVSIPLPNSPPLEEPHQISSLDSMSGAQPELEAPASLETQSSSEVVNMQESVMDSVELEEEQAENALEDVELGEEIAPPVPEVALEDIHPEDEHPVPPLPPKEFPTEQHNPSSTNGFHPPPPLKSPLSPPPSVHKRSLTMVRGNTVSAVLISSALETIAASKEAKRSTPLRESTQRALTMVRANDVGNPREVFEPLRLACETKNEKLMVASLDCISKLISYSFFAEPNAEPSDAFPSPPPSPNTSSQSSHASSSASPQAALVDLVAHTIAACHSETISESVSLQILVLSPTTLVHHSSLLKAVRTVYNVFLVSNDPVNQMVAQGGLTQMVHHVFTRCKVSSGGTRTPMEPFPLSASQDDALSSVHHPFPPASISNGHTNGSEHRPSTDSSSSLPLPSNGSTQAESESDSLRRTLSPEPSDHLDHDSQHANRLTTNDLFIKDAFLVFRALCKLTMKPLNTESERDLKSHAMRSKILSLHLVLTILNSHMPLFPPTFAQAVNQFLCLCLSRNAVSPVPQVFDISVEIFWRVLSGMRTKLKDPQALVEIYLNYDCDGNASDNIYEHLMNIISKIGTTPSAHQKATEPPSPAVTPTTSKTHSNTAHNPLSTSALSVPGSMDTSTMGLSESQLKRQGLECLVTVLRSLVVWGAPPKTIDDSAPTPSVQTLEDARRDSATSFDRLSTSAASTEGFRQPTPELADDFTKFESAKEKKTALLEGIKKFNFKPKRGIEFLVRAGFIPSKSPQDIATFLLNTDGLSKAMIGEYLGEGDEENIAIMHAFVDQMDFKNLPFVEALRVFLQAFRLPGESQKIDRYMLKFAERYIAGNTQTPFANADTAYVLAYSTILLNTDQYNPQVKRRMTKADFRKNNRGINADDDLAEEFLDQIFDDIVSNEIRMKDEVESDAPILGPGLAGALSNVGRDLQREAYVIQTSGMANRTEALFKTMMRTSRRGPNDQFFSASHFRHVRPMFEVAWIPFLAGLSGPLQDSDDLEIVELCLDGFKSAIRIVCVFDLELERNAFVTTLAKFTFLNNLGEMKTKNMEAIKTLLDVAVTEGNNLKSSWHEVLTCVSQLERMQLISSGVDLPESSRKGKSRKLPTEELANESRSRHITVAADMVFSLSHFLNRDAIRDFVRALCDVSWEEIQSSGLSQQPRLFSLQKLVEISYYNMSRIRIEWSILWEILGEHFNQVCCHNNPHVGFFALDSLRQLAMRFLEKEELPHFVFQKDFLKPFEHTMIHNANPEVRDMVLQCLQQMIQARVQNMRSGWRTMFGVFQAASKVLTERIANSAFEIVTRLNKDHFNAIVRHGAFADLTVCITEFCKVSKYQKISLLAIAMLRGVIPVMLECPECSWDKVSPTSPSPPIEDNLIKYWYPVLFGFYDIIMNGEDLEVRRLALDSLFTTLKTYGKTFPVDFWDHICKELLFPIFAVLKSSQDLSRFSTQEDMSVWLSTTMIQALRDLIDLYTFYFDILERFIDGLLDLLCVCICQENDTLARIGTSCLQQLLENNVSKLSPVRWERVATAFVKLFKTTTPHQLFDESLRVEVDGNSPDMAESESNGETILPAPLSPHGEHPRPDSRMSTVDRRRIFKQIIVKCVLQLLLIETTNDLLRNNAVYSTIPPEQLLRLMGVLDHSYQFARMFNDDKELRTGLWKVGFMKHLPNLLKQESSSASTLVHVLFRMYYDPRPEHQTARPQIADRLMPLGLGVIQDYNKLRPDTQGKNIVAWTPVVAEILDGFCRFDDKSFARYLPAIYPLATELLDRDVAPEVRQCLKTYFRRVGYAQGMIELAS
ncbi:sec7 guanine nucleotide exchange factor [Mycena floridula]|nr:sec7 guanine nucleotide exchange factor [Mycena floridula]